MLHTSASPINCKELINMHFAQEHTSSYYAASANRVTGFPRLKGDMRADVCVIGGGFTGISTALTLAERSYNVCVLEANRIGWGASGRNGGQLIAGISGEQKILDIDPGIADLVWDMRWRGHEIIQQRVEHYEIDCDLKYGYVDVAIKPRHVSDLQAEENRLAKRDVPFEHKLLSQAETCEALGTDAYIGALQIMGNGHLHPLNLCIGEAEAAVSLGAQLYEQSAAMRIDHGDSVRVSTAEGSITADFAVIAGNAYQSLVKSVSGRFFPVRSYIIATEPLSEEQLDTINPHDFAVCDPNFVLEYFRLSADKRLLFGGRCNYFGDDQKVIASQLKPRMLKIYPQLRDIAIDYAWGGTIAVPMNRVPQLGRTAKNVFYSNAYAGHGVNVTHLAGEIMADVIGGTAEKFDVFSRFRSTRIPGVTYFGNAMVSMGLIYYGLKDKW
ncbi:MAG: FAD-binding oxidoreductase [Proteobacteria bacterium]|nr:FAD-binding oxidoreductase [Pseudomonadota bacterium]MDA0992585.1 FAD-binding oxidoreductase [Pseudomonadota bacterium]